MPNYLVKLLGQAVVILPLGKAGYPDFDMNKVIYPAKPKMIQRTEQIFFVILVYQADHF